MNRVFFFKDSLHFLQKKICFLKEIIHFLKEKIDFHQEKQVENQISLLEFFD